MVDLRTECFCECCKNNVIDMAPALFFVSECFSCDLFSVSGNLSLLIYCNSETVYLDTSTINLKKLHRNLVIISFLLT